MTNRSQRSRTQTARLIFRGHGEHQPVQFMGGGERPVIGIGHVAHPRRTTARHPAPRARFGVGGGAGGGADKTVRGRRPARFGVVAAPAKPFVGGVSPGGVSGRGKSPRISLVMSRNDGRTTWDWSRLRTDPRARHRPDKSDITSDHRSLSAGVSRDSRLVLRRRRCVAVGVQQADRNQADGIDEFVGAVAGRVLSGAGRGVPAESRREFGRACVTALKVLAISWTDSANRSWRLADLEVLSICQGNDQHPDPSSRP